MSEKLDFGSLLRQAREDRGLTVADLADATKIPRRSLDALESGDVAALPADVFVRGFIRSYAKTVGVSEGEPLALYERSLAARAAAAAAPAPIAAAAGSAPSPSSAAAGFSTLAGGDEDGAASRRGVGLAVFVIILLLIATITLSLLLRRPPQSGEGLSWKSGPAGSGDVERLSPRA